MTTRVHIERLIVDEGGLAARDVPRFASALSTELERLRAGSGETPVPPGPGWQGLAQRTAAAIHDRMPAPAGGDAP